MTEKTARRVREIMKSKEIKELVVRATEHDAEAFTGLMQYFTKDMYRTAIAILRNSEDAADAMQDTVLACWEKIGSLREACYFKTWMTRVLINKCYDIQKQRIDKVPMDECEELAAGEDHSQRELQEVLGVLEERYRLPLTLFYGEGYKIREIAQILDIPQSTVQTRLSRGRAKLAAYYEDREDA